MNEFQQLGVGQQAGQQFPQQQLPQQQFSQQQFPQQQLSPQGFFGSTFGAPLGGLIGRGIGGLLGNSQLGGQIGQMAGGIGGAFLPLSADPYQQQLQQQLQQQQLAQQAQGQLAPQGWVADAFSQFGKPLGGFIGGLAGNQQLGSTIGGIASQLGGMLPFAADPSQQQQLQQVQQQPVQQGQPAQTPVGSWLSSLPRFPNLPIFGKPPLSSYIPDYIPPRQPGQAGQPYGGFLPFSAGPQQGQLAPQGWVADAFSQFGKPLGGFIGGLAGNQQLGSTIGGIASQLGGMLPFAAGPQQQVPQQQVQPPQLVSQAVQQQLQQLLQFQQHIQQLIQQHQQQLQAQQGGQGQGQGQGQMAPQGWVADAFSQFGKPLGGFIGGLAGNQQLGSTIGGIASQLGGMLPFSVDPYQMQQLAQQQAQQGQLAPQGWVANAFSQFAQPLGGLIGSLAGNQQLGSTIGGIASQLGGMLPFSVDPYQMQQLAQQQGQQQGQGVQPGQYPIYTSYPQQGQGQTLH